MAKAKQDTTFISELANPGLYKRNQGRLVRQVTAVAIAVIVLLGASTLATQSPLREFKSTGIRWGIPAAVAIVGLWFAYRAVNYPKFADFLIAVEGEMDKVSWPDLPYLIRATGVVLVVMFLLGFLLFAYDLFWQWFFKLIGFLRI